MANGVTSINLTTLTVGAGANRALVAQINWSGTNATPALTWDSGGTNQAMALVTGATATSTTVAQANLWGLVAPTSGAKTLAATWGTARDVVLNATSWTGVNQTGGATSFPNGAGATGSSVTASVTVTSAVGDAVMASHTLLNTCSAVNNTQTYRDNTPANIGGAGNRAAGAASVALTATLTSAVWASAGCSIAASGAAAAFMPRPNPFHGQAVNRASTF